MIGAVTTKSINKDNSSTESKKKLWKMMDMFTTLMVVMVSQVHVYLQTQVVHIKYTQVLASHSCFNEMVVINLTLIC